MTVKTHAKESTFHHQNNGCICNPINIDGKPVYLTPGMILTAEIKTGQRRVIEYLLSPIQQAGNESLRER